MDAWTEWANAQHVYWREVATDEQRKKLGDVPVNDINGALAFRAERPERCPVCGGLNPGDITHTRCQ